MQDKQNGRDGEREPTDFNPLWGSAPPGPGSPLAPGLPEPQTPQDPPIPEPTAPSPPLLPEEHYEDIEDEESGGNEEFTDGYGPPPLPFSRVGWYDPWDSATKLEKRNIKILLMVLPVIFTAIATFAIISNRNYETATKPISRPQVNIDQNAVNAAIAAKDTFTVEIDSPSPGEVARITSVPIAGEVRDSFGLEVKEALVTVMLNGSIETTTTTMYDGRFYTQIELDTADLNIIKVIVIKGEKSGYDEVDCYYQPEPAGQ